MDSIEIRTPDKDELECLEVFSWPIWRREECSFDWEYDEKETCYFLEGEVNIETAKGVISKIKKGDLAIFPKGLVCKWHITKAVKKHYKFG
ncbi:MAG: cupin domain-containing protein [Candidatus Omnitrophica bacterium]|nr:cupin domain-containing protein [Candidatus Omnitrophota bacterium]